MQPGRPHHKTPKLFLDNRKKKRPPPVGGGVSRRRHREGVRPCSNYCSHVPRAVAGLERAGHVRSASQAAGYRSLWTPSFSSSSSWMMIRGVTIIIRLWVSRPMPTFLNSRLM